MEEISINTARPIKTFAEVCHDLLNNDPYYIETICEHFGFMNKNKNNPFDKLFDQKWHHKRLFYIPFMFCRLDEMLVEYGENGEYIFELDRKSDKDTEELTEFRGRIFKNGNLELECICDLKNEGFKITQNGSREGLKILLKNIADFVFLTKQKG